MLSIAAFFVDPFVISIGFEPILDLPLRTYRKAFWLFAFNTTDTSILVSFFLASFEVVEDIGVEPMTSCVQGRRSSQLS